jgi:hypothetical protein
MDRRLRETRGQAFVELAMVVFLFYMVITAVIQFVLLGSAQIRCQEAARRAAWLRNIYHNSPAINHNGEEVKQILPLQNDPIKISGSLEKGMAFKADYTVPSIGFFHIFKPEGFPISAQSAVIADNPKPGVVGLTQITTSKVLGIIRRIQNHD